MHAEKREHHRQMFAASMPMGNNEAEHVHRGNSWQVTGRRPFRVTYVGIHMIRSTICIDLLLVALILKVSSSTLSVSVFFCFQTRKRSQTIKSIPRLLKFDPHWPQNPLNFASRAPKIKQNRPPETPKAIQNASPKRHCFKGCLRTSICSNSGDLLTPKYPPQASENPSENDLEKQQLFIHVFSKIWGYLGTQNTPKINLRRCKADFRKSLFYLSKTYVFEAWALWKTPFLLLETHPRKLISKNMIFN